MGDTQKYQKGFRVKNCQRKKQTRKAQSRRRKFSDIQSQNHIYISDYPLEGYSALTKICDASNNQPICIVLILLYNILAFPHRLLLCLINTLKCHNFFKTTLN